MTDFLILGLSACNIGFHRYYQIFVGIIKFGNKPNNSQFSLALLIFGLVWFAKVAHQTAPQGYHLVDNARDAGHIRFIGSDGLFKTYEFYNNFMVNSSIPVQT